MGSPQPRRGGAGAEDRKDAKRNLESLHMRKLLRIFGVFTSLSISVFGQCGTERWPVKTGTDADASAVNLNSSSSTTIANLVALMKPSDLPENSRIRPTEATVFVVTATLIEFKNETDSDYHLVLSDSTGKTMIAEIPAPSCVASVSPFASRISSARSKFDAQFKATGDFKPANISVQITGVAFFDFLHGQTGVAPNGIELHPVLDILFNPPSINSVETAGGFQGIAQNTWIAIKGSNLAPVSPTGGTTWSNAPEFASGKMPTQLNTVSAKVNGKAAYVYYASTTQVNLLTPLDSALGPVEVVVTNGANSSSPFVMQMGTVAPSFIPIAGGKYVVAEHVDGSLLGPASLSVPGYVFTPAEPGETIVLFAFGFGLPVTPLVDGSATQFASLPDLPSIRIGGVQATVQYAGVISPGLYQFNVVVPDTAADGDNSLIANYGGAATPGGTALAVQRR